jgi:hypothetical protein
VGRKKLYPAQAGIFYDWKSEHPHPMTMVIQKSCIRNMQWRTLQWFLAEKGFQIIKNKNVTVT